MTDRALTVATIGHSTLGLDEFIEAIRAQQVHRLIDVRTIPRSRHNPQFNRDTLPSSLVGVGIEYEHVPGLGGLRRPVAGSSNTGWRNASFRGFADYMQTPSFAEAFDHLLRRAQEVQLCLMCAEAVPWRCHRSLIADALVARGVRVRHLYGATRASAHEIHPMARLEQGRVVYPARTA